MTFPNAANGIKKLFVGEVLALIVSVATAVSILIARPVEVGDTIDITATGASLGIAGILLGLSGIVAIVAYILMLVGIVKASKDEEAFKLALYVILFSLAVSIIGAIFAYLFPNNWLLANLGTVVANVAEIFSAFLIIGGIGSLGEKIGDPALVEKAGKLLGIILTVIVLKLIANFVLLFFKESIAAVLVTILGIMLLIFAIVQYVLYLSLLSHAKNSLATK